MFQSIDFGSNCKDDIKNTKYMIQYDFIENNHFLGMIIHKYYLNKL